jgi:ABC-type transporter Mla MlaB component
MTGYTVSFARGADNRQNHAPRDPRLYERAHLVKPADVIFRNHEKVKHGCLLDISRTGAKIAVPQGGVRLGSRLEGEFVGVSGISIVFVAEVMHWSEWATEAGVRFIGMSGDGARQIGEYISELKGSGKACVVSTSDRMVIVQGALLGRMTRPFLKACEAVQARQIDLGQVIEADSGGVGLLMIAKERWGSEVSRCPQHIRDLLNLSRHSSRVLGSRHFA